MVKGIYQVDTSSRQTRTKPPITPPIIKFSRNNGRAVPKEPPGTHEKGSRIYFYGRDFEIDSRSKWKNGQVVVVKRKDAQTTAAAAETFRNFRRVIFIT